MTARITWHGSIASAKILEDHVNRIDARSDRGAYHPNEYASAEAEITTIGYAAAPIRTTATCVVDTYAGRYVLGNGDTLVQTDTGWVVEEVERP